MRNRNQGISVDSHKGVGEFVFQIFQCIGYQQIGVRAVGGNVFLLRQKTLDVVDGKGLQASVCLAAHLAALWTDTAQGCQLQAIDFARTG